MGLSEGARAAAGQTGGPSAGRSASSLCSFPGSAEGLAFPHAGHRVPVLLYKYLKVRFR